MSALQKFPVLALEDAVVLPGMVVPIELDEPARAAVDAARTSNGDRLLVAPRLEDRYATHGVIATIQQVGRMPGGGHGAVIRAEQRAHIQGGVTGPGAALWVEAELLEDAPASDAARELAKEYKGLVVTILQKRNAWQVIDSVQRLTDPSALADTAGYASYLELEQKRELLETPDVEARLTMLTRWATDYLAETEVNESIADSVHESIEKNQREFLLRQQLAAIRKELGDDEPEGTQDYRARVEEADLPEDVRKAALREVGKLERGSDQNPESGYIRTWLDVVLELPWGNKTEDNTDITAAREVLDADHHGLDDVKDRIVEYLAVRARRSERGLEIVGGRGSGAVMALVGPPGVGKTSLGESVARALGRKFVRVALGGVRDEAEIRGHRRTYVGALPGRLVRAITEAGSMNPVVLLDEIDKVGSDYRGDPAAALLEVLDPAQNHTFRDHYLDLDLDLSDVLFLATANVIESIPQALLDRMELVQLDGYTEDDKVAIARQYLAPRQLERAALKIDEVEITDEALREIAAFYTREAGVRQMERLLAKVYRKVATKLADASVKTPIVVDKATIVDFIGRPRFTPESAERTAVPGERGLTITGQLGDVMKESAQIALSYVRSHAAELGVDPEALERSIHLHVLAGAQPKDGPSAGVTMITALTSMALGRNVRADVGMTGEVTLNGRVLPIGGVKQKLMAAQRAGLKTVFIPARNEVDLVDVPDEVLAELDVRPVADVAEILALAFESEKLEPATGFSGVGAA
ncbi:MAG: S16 family serine protease [Aeromicrobium sp.]